MSLFVPQNMQKIALAGQVRAIQNVLAILILDKNYTTGKMP